MSKELREQFFKDLTFKDVDGVTRVILLPHNIFEWIKVNIIEDYESQLAESQQALQKALSEIKQLEHYKDTTVNLWAADRPELIIDSKNIMFKLEYVSEQPTKEELKLSVRGNILVNQSEQVYDENPAEPSIKAEHLEEKTCEHAYGDNGCSMMDINGKCTPYPDGSTC